MTLREEIRKPFQMNLPPDLIQISGIFQQAGKQLFVVGGAVRDALMGKEPKDYDVASDATPDEVIAIFRPHTQYKILEIGKAFGVIKILTPEGGEYEVATFRADVGKGRRPDSVNFTTIDQDVQRRDLTINALFYDISRQEIVDYVGGIADIENNVVRTVGNPDERFDEDRLRVLRALRFAGRMGSSLDPATDAAIKANNSLEGVSGERIRDEFLKGLTSSKSVLYFLGLVSTYNLWGQIFPGLVVNTNFVETRNIPVQLALLLRDNKPEILAKTLNKLKYSATEAAQVSFLAIFQTLASENAFKLKKFFKNAHLSNQDVLEFARLNGKPDEKTAKAFTLYEPTITGDELTAAGFKGADLGKEMSRRETELFQGQIQEGEIRFSLSQFINEVIEEELNEAKPRYPVTSKDTIGGKHGADVRGIKFYHASPVRFRHGDIITGGHSGGSGYAHSNVCMTTSPVPHGTIASNIPGWSGSRTHDRPADDFQPVQDKDWYVYEVEPRGKVHYVAGNGEYQAASAMVLKNIGKATAFLSQEPDYWQAKSDPQQSAREPAVERERIAKHADRQQKKIARLDNASRHDDEELDEYTRIDEPKRDGLPVSGLGLNANGGVANIISVYNQATPEEKEYWGQWYHNAKSGVQDLATEFNLPFPVVAAIVAVLSPGNRWHGNLIAAEKLLNGDPKVNAYPRQADRARAILKTGDTSLVTGPKVSVFFKSLLDPKSVEKDMVLDSHAINIWRGVKTSIKALKNPTVSERAQMIKDYQQAAKELGVPVQAVQAVTWYIWKYTKNDVAVDVNKGTYDVSKFKGAVPANDNANYQSAVSEANAVGGGGIAGTGGSALGVDNASMHKELWSGDESEPNKVSAALKSENVLDKMGMHHVGGAARKEPYGDTYVDKDDDGKQAAMIRKVNKNLDKKPYSLKDPPSMGISIQRPSLKDRK